MGTRMIVYEIPKKQWWTFAEKIFKFYIEKSWQAELVRLHRVKNITKIWEFLHDRNNHVELQLFEFRDVYYIRVLELGYFFMNNQPEHFPEVTLHFYDNHGDMTPEMEAEETLVEWIDKRIRNHQYLVYPIIDQSSDVMKLLGGEDE